jgi:hypothetical protein
LYVAADGRGKTPFGSAGVEGQGASVLQAVAEEKIAPLSLLEIQGRGAPVLHGKDGKGRLAEVGEEFCRAGGRFEEIQR